MKHLRSLFLVSALAFTCMLAPSAPAADLSVTAASFQAGAGAQFITGTAGADIMAGQLVTISPSTGKFVLASGADVTLRKVAGIAGGNAAAGQPLAVVYSADNMVLGATLSMSFPVYVLSATAGGIAPSADLGAGNIYPSVVIVATSTSTCIFRAPGIAGGVKTIAD